MTFEEWWETALIPDSRMALAWEAWQEAARQERERCVSRSLAAVDAVLEDLTDRRGLRQEWEQIDIEIQMEIMNAWKDAIAIVIGDEDIPCP